jgi:neutral ceramidase
LSCGRSWPSLDRQEVEVSFRKTYLFFVFCLLALPLEAALRVGVGTSDITPPAGVPMAGYYHVRLSEGVHDPLQAKAILLENGGVQAALVTCDLVSLPRPLVEQARAEIEKLTGVPGSSVMISATHSHTGPVTSLGWLERAGGEAADKGKAYLQRLPSLIAQSVKNAQAQLQSVEVEAVTGQETSVSFNRRYLMKDGTVGWNPGKLNPQTIRTVGPTDPQLPLIVFKAEGKETPAAAFVNFALHLDTVGGTKYSADYPFTISSLLAEVYPGLVTLFTMGSSGNVNHINVWSKTPQQGSGEAARIGAILAGEVLRSFAELQGAGTGPLQVRREILKLDLARIEAGEVDKAREVAAKYGEPGAAPFLEMVHAFKVLEIAERQGQPIEAEVQVITLGDEIAWVGLPGEIFVELGLAIKTASPFRYTVVSTLTNGSWGYFPDLKAFAEGNYEPVSARTAPGSGETLVQSATKLLVESYKALQAKKDRVSD